MSDQGKSNAVHEVFAYLRVRGAEQAIDYYRRAFGAELVMRLDEAGTGRIDHAELKIGPAIVMLSDEYPEYGIQGPQALGERPFPQVKADTPVCHPERSEGSA